MKKRISIIIAMALLATAMLTGMAVAGGDDNGNNEKQQRVVYALEDGRTRVLQGDPDERSSGRNEMLPGLLNESWRISKIVPVENNSDRKDRVIAIIVLEK